MTGRAARIGIAVAVVVGVGTLPAQEPKPSTPVPAATPRPATATPVATPVAAPPSLRGRLTYKPVLRGVPAGRVDAGSRGDGDEIASLYALAPQHVGLTTRSQPVLHWFQTRPADVPFELAILRENQPRPLLRVRRDDARRSGFQRLDLGEHGVVLAEGVEYQWVIALIRDSESRSRDIVSSGWIKRVPPLASPQPSAVVFAEQGIWYDALDTIMRQVAARPKDLALRAVRDDLLAQVQLTFGPERLPRGVKDD